MSDKIEDDPRFADVYATLLDLTNAADERFAADDPYRAIIVQARGVLARGRSGPVDLSPDEAQAVASALRYKADAFRRMAEDGRAIGEGKTALGMAAAELDRLAARFAPVRPGGEPEPTSSSPAP